MSQIYQKLRSYAGIIYIATLFLYLLRIFSKYYFPSIEITGYLLGLIAILFLVISIPQLKGFMRYLIYFMLLAGTIMFFSSGRGFLEYLLGIQDMVNVLCVFMVLELIGFPVAITDLRPLFRPMLKATKKPAFLFSLLSFVSMVLGSIINMAIVPLIYYSMWESLQERGLGYTRNLAVSLKRGLALSLFWSPFGIMMAVIIEYSGVPWIQIAPITFFLALVALLVSFFSEYLLSRGKAMVAGGLDLPPDAGEHFWKTFRTLTSYVFTLIAFVLAINSYTSLGMIDTLIIISVIVPLAWSLVTGILPTYLQKTVQYFQIKVPGYGQPFSLFIAAGVFAVGLRSFGFESLLDQFLLLSFETLGSIGIIMIIVSVIMLLSWVGVHPVVSLVLIGQNLNFQSGIIPPLYYAIAMIIGGSLSNLTSPISAVTLVTAGLFQKNPFEVGITWNALFIVMFLCILPLIFFSLMHI